MQAQANVFPVQTQVVGQTQVIPVQTITSHGQQRNAINGVGVVEIVFRGLCTAFSVAILIATIVTLSELNSAGEYEYSGGSRGAAGWMLFVAIASLIFHGTMICVRVLYAISVIKKNYSGYAFTNAIICAIFGLALLSGGIANAVYGKDNSKHYDNTVYPSQFATAAFSAMSLVMLLVLIFALVQDGIRRWHEDANQSSKVALLTSSYYSLD